MTIRTHQLHPYLRERIRDLHNHGYCRVEHQLIMEDESIWGGYNVDDFNSRVVEHFDGRPFLMEEQPNGDLLIRSPRNAAEQAQAVGEFIDAANGQINEAAFSDDGLHSQRKLDARKAWGQREAKRFAAYNGGGGQ